VAALSPSDVWVVGRTEVTPAPNRDGIVAHWNGTRWSLVRLARGNPFWDVVALGSHAVAVGDVGVVTLGASVNLWSGGRGPGRSISVVSPTDVWLLTYGGVDHWDGRQWTSHTLPLPSSAVDGEWYAISAVAGDEVWVVGSYVPPNGPDTGLGLTWHYDGKMWARSVSKPVFDDVSVLSATDVWGVGRYPEWPPALVGHWNGSSWDRKLYSAAGSLNAVQSLSHTDVWAVGNRGILDDGAVAIHWDGHRWTDLDSPTVKGRTLNALSVLSDQDVWAVGSTFHQPHSGQGAGTFVPLVEHYTCSG
jgi:hypothetical protein